MAQSQADLLTELVDLRERLGITDVEMARRMGITRQHLSSVLARKYQPGPKVELGLLRLRQKAQEDARAMLAAMGEVATFLVGIMTV